jgi:predicted HicB family RNase H-like nuclease
VNDLMVSNEGFAGRCQKVLQVARQLHQGKPDWVTFFRETLGVNGAARSVFPTQDEYVRFEQSHEFAEIQKLVANLRTRRAGGKHEPTRVITVRLPESLHEALKAEANDHNTSMNKLCISKLLQVLVDNEKQGQAAPQANATRSRATLPMSSQSPGTTPTVPIVSSTSSNPAFGAPQTPNFRSTFGQPTASPNNMPSIRRYGQ